MTTSSPRSSATQYQIRQTATQLFLEHGFDDVTMVDIAKAIGIEPQTLYAYYGGKFDIILELYQVINAEWQIAVGNLTETKLHERFAAAMMLKIELMDPYADLLAGMMGYLLRSDKVGVGAHRTGHVRQQGLQTMQLLVSGAKDAGRMQRKIHQLPSALYLVHWTLLLLHVQGGNLANSRESVALAAKMLQKAKDAAFFLPLFPFLKDLGAWADRLVGLGRDAENRTTDAILKLIFQHRKLSEASAQCEQGDCETCLKLHRPTISHFVAANQPIHFVLPAFPAKSPNPNKTLGPLPDLGEEIALQTLQTLCNEIQAIYPPGASVTICSDGRIFSTLVEVADETITAYVAQLRTILAERDLTSVEVMNLEDLLPGMSLDAARAFVMDQYAEPLETLRLRLKSSPEFLALFNGIHRFISEDRSALHPEVSHSKIKSISKEVALEVIRNSNAWTRFLAQVYPEAVRLSIHPYPAHSEKIGIRLTKAKDNWLTPWHGAIVLGDDGYVLMKLQDALEAGATMVSENGRPHHLKSSRL